MLGLAHEITQGHLSGPFFYMRGFLGSREISGIYSPWRCLHGIVIDDYDDDDDNNNKYAGLDGMPLRG